VLHNDVLPFYRDLDLPIRAVLTDNGREFCGTEQHPYELYLALNDIEHRRTRIRTPRTTDEIEQPFFKLACYLLPAHGRPRGEEQGVR
jgi:hypothetical protein